VGVSKVFGSPDTSSYVSIVGEQEGFLTGQDVNVTFEELNFDESMVVVSLESDLLSLPVELDHAEISVFSHGDPPAVHSGNVRMVLSGDGFGDEDFDHSFVESDLVVNDGEPFSLNIDDLRDVVLRGDSALDAFGDFFEALSMSEFFNSVMSNLDEVSAIDLGFELFAKSTEVSGDMVDVFVVTDEVAGFPNLTVGSIVSSSDVGFDFIIVSDEFFVGGDFRIFRFIIFPVSTSGNLVDLFISEVFLFPVVGQSFRFGNSDFVEVA